MECSQVRVDLQRRALAACCSAPPIPSPAASPSTPALSTSTALSLPAPISPSIPPALSQATAPSIAPSFSTPPAPFAQAVLPLPRSLPLLWHGIQAELSPSISIPPRINSRSRAPSPRAAPRVRASSSSPPVPVSPSATRTHSSTLARPISLLPISLSRVCPPASPAPSPSLHQASSLMSLVRRSSLVHQPPPAPLTRRSLIRLLLQIRRQASAPPIYLQGSPLIQSPGSFPARLKPPALSTSSSALPMAPEPAPPI